MWGERIGAVVLDPRYNYYAFRYTPEFRRSGLEPAPLQMPVGPDRTLLFTDLPVETYKRLPALLSDALPDDFGNALINRWMADRGMSAADITPIDRLACMSNRAMGALQFKPSRGPATRTAAAIRMSDLVTECRLMEENGRAHFMTRRFDREASDVRHHVQTLCAMSHVDFKKIGTNSYSQLFDTAGRLGLPYPDREEIFRRMVFNVMGQNCDDHSKNFAFRLKRAGVWELAPAYDVTFAHSPSSKWTHQHLMSVNGKFSGIAIEDMLEVADRFGIGTARHVMDQVHPAIKPS